jgi:hypothetical protein
MTFAVKFSITCAAALVLGALVLLSRKQGEPKVEGSAIGIGKDPLDLGLEGKGGKK